VLGTGNPEPFTLFPVLTFSEVPFLAQVFTKFRVPTQTGCKGSDAGEVHDFLMMMSVMTSMAMIVPDHDGGRPIEVNACILITHMVYL
jgi:hypothetical protein